MLEVSIMDIDQDIKSLNLECIAYKVCRDEMWSLEKTDLVELKYRAFLQVIRDSGLPKEISPTRDIDIFWHHHILDTQKYSEDCQAIFGFFLHHYPYSGIFSEEDAAAQQERMMRSVSLINETLKTRRV